jgi:hypothetical protein
MQFHHAHTFRGPVVEALCNEMPDVLGHLEAAGASVANGPTAGPWPCCAVGPPSMPYCGAKPHESLESRCTPATSTAWCVTTAASSA